MSSRRSNTTDLLLQSLIPRVAAGWLATDDDSGYRSLTGTMLHADLTGSTRLGEQLLDAGREGNEVLIEQVNTAFEPIISSCLRHGGDILKFGGDAVLVFFSDDGHERRALQSASEMQLGLAAARRRREKVVLEVTVGVHSGDFDFWMVGRNQKDLVVAGINGTRVVEIEEQAAPGQVMASPETLDRMSQRGQPTVVFELGEEPRPPLPAVDVAGRLVPSRVLSELGSIALTAGEHRLVTAGFVLCQGVERALAEGSVTELADQIGRLFRTVQQVQADYGVSFLHSDIAQDGFKILLAAGAPVSLGEENEAMLRAVCKLVDCPIELTLRGSLHRGPLFAGLLGTERRRTYSLMGDDVNLASHLLAQAGHRQVVVTRSTLEAVANKPAFRSLDPFLVKGKSTPVDGALVEGYQSTTGSDPWGSDHLDLVGRTTEWRTLATAGDDVLSGRRRVLRIEGEVGVGKTRLLQEFGSRNRRMVLALHSADRFETSTPFAGARSLIRQAFEIDTAAEPSLVGRALEDLGRGIDPRIRPLLPLLSPVIDASVPPTSEANTIGAEFRTSKAAEVAAHILRSRSKPVCLMVDDSQWTDPASGAFLADLQVHAGDGPWLFVSTGPTTPAVNADGDDTVDDGNDERLLLQPLHGAELRQLVINAAAPERLTTSQLQSICERSAGNPLFAIQLAILRTGNELPTSVEDLLRAQLDLLPVQSRTILKVASIFGREMSTEVLERFLVDEVSIDHELDLQTVGDYLSAADDRLVFTNDLLRQVAYNSLPYRVRRRWHQSAGTMLENERAVGHDVSSAALALHFDLGGDRAKTWTYGREAGLDAAERYANREAIEAYRRALTASARLRGVTGDDRAAVALDMGDIFERLGAYDDADEAFTTARRLASDPFTRAQATQRRSWIRIQQGRWRSAKSMQTRLLSELGQETLELRRLRRTVQLDRLGQLTRTGTRSEYDDLEGTVVASARADNDEMAVARAHQYRLGNLSNPPPPDQAASMAASAAKAFQADGDIAAYASTMNNFGFYCHVRYDWKQAVAAYDSAAEAFGRVGDDVRLATVNNNLGELCSDRGEYEAAERCYKDPERVWSAADYQIGLGVLAANQGRLRLRTGDVMRALDALDRSLTILHELRADAFVAEATLRKAEALLVAGRIAEASLLLDAVEQIDGRDVDSMAPWLHLARGVAAHLDGRAVDARRHVVDALDASAGGYDELHARRSAGLLGVTDVADPQRIDELERALDIVGLPLLLTTPGIGGQSGVEAYDWPDAAS